MNFTFDQLVSLAQITTEDMNQINRCRRDYNRLGFGYQLSFVKIMNRFPAQKPLEISEEILSYVSVQLSLSVGLIESYSQRRQTVSEHQIRIKEYLNLNRCGDDEEAELETFIFEEACRLEQTAALFSKVEQFLKDKKILKPADDKIRRLIGTQRQEARQYIFKKVANSLSDGIRGELDSITDTEGKRVSLFNELKKSPGKPSPKAMLKLTHKIELIGSMGILDIDLSWLNNNFQRSLARHAKKSTATKIRRLQDDDYRHTVLICFLRQLFRDTVDFAVDMFDKLVNKIYNAAQNDVDKYNKSQRKNIRESLKTYYDMLNMTLDDSEHNDSLQNKFFQEIGKDVLTLQREIIKRWLQGKHSHVFNLVKERFSYIRQFSPSFLKNIEFNFEGGENSPLNTAVTTLREMNDENKRKLPDDAPTDFIPKKIRNLVENEGKVDKAAWECALLTAVRDEIKSGNISVGMSKRFGRLDDFFMSEEKWLEIMEGFFARAGLPSNPNDVRKYLTDRLNNAYDRFLKNLPKNTYTRIEEDGWHFSTDSAEQLSAESKARLESLKSWLSANMRVVKLPELLIEVDNELKITRNFMAANKQENPTADDICAVLATIMAHGCNIGPYTMAHLIEGVSYSRIKNITDWMLTEETQRRALAQVVNAISRLDITQAWGQGQSSSSDGQRFAMNRRVLQQTYSPKFNDFALEFYTFVADNFAPFYSFPIECTERDAPYVLDGLLYNESDLPLEGEHYVDTHGYTENNFSAFGMLARKYAPRIKGLHKQRIYIIDKNKDYQQLTPLVNRKDRTLNVDWIVDQWHRLGHFYASLECGHVTASTAMKRLNGYTGKNHFYRANRELGRIFKTEYILNYLSDKAMRQRIRRGLLKGEQIHALARDLNYGKRGRVSKADLYEQRMSCSCMTLILACIIYWQAKEINRVVLECDPEKNNIDLSLLEHISPIAWDNVILYGEYVLNRNLIQTD